MDEYLKNLTKNAEIGAESLQDKGHLKLVADVHNLLQRIIRGEHHDFHRNGLPAPKMALLEAFNELKTGLMDGDYDNR